MMKNKCQIRFATLRRTLILPFFIAVFSLLCFTMGKSEVRYVEKKSELQESQNSVNAVEKSRPEANTKENILNDSVKINSENNTLTLGMDKSTSDSDIRKGMADFSNGLGNAIKKLNTIVENYNTTTLKKDLVDALTSLDIKTNQQNVAGFELSDAFISSVSRKDIKNTVDNLSKIKTKMDELRKDKLSNEQTQSFASLAVSVIGDNLISKIMFEAMQRSMPGLQVKQFSEHFSGMAKFDTTLSTPTTTSRVTSAVRELSNAEIKQKETDDKLWREAHRLTPDQYKISDLPFPASQVEKLVRIERNRNETKLTFAIPVYNDQWWIYFSSGLTIVDKKTKDQYIVRRVEKELPLNQTLIVTGCGMKMIEITEVFPPLKSSVELIDILTLTNDFPNMMSNRGPNTEFRNVRISDYSKETSGKVYR